jgi:hypothetical protein
MKLPRQPWIKSIAIIVLCGAGFTLYCSLNRTENTPRSLSSRRAPGVFSEAELAVAMAKSPPSTTGALEYDLSTADLVVPEPVTQKGHAKTPEEFRVAMDEAKRLQAEWKHFTGKYREAPRSDWNRAARHWQQSRSARLTSVRDHAGITFPLRHPSDEPPDPHADALVPDYLNPQRSAPASPNVLAFRRERDRLAAERDAAVHATAGMPPLQRMQKMKEWEITHQFRLAASRSAAFMLRELPLELIPPAPNREKAIDGGTAGTPPPQAVNNSDPSTQVSPSAQ